MEVITLLILVYKNKNVQAKRFKNLRYYFPICIIKNYNINGKIFYEKSIDSDIKRYEAITKSTTGHCEDYTTGSLLDYYRLIAVDLSRQKELDTVSKTIQQFGGQLKKTRC